MKLTRNHLCKFGNMIPFCMSSQSMYGDMFVGKETDVCRNTTGKITAFKYGEEDGNSCGVIFTTPEFTVRIHIRENDD